MSEAPKETKAEASNPEAVSSLSLGAWSLNPVFLKEILVYERGGSATPTRAAILALALITVVMVFLTLAVYFPGPWRFAGRVIGLGTLALLAFASYGVMVPAATSIALERDRETFDTLTVSSLESGRLIRGKILGAFAIGLMTKAPLLPACGVAYLFGGLSISLFLAFLVVIVSVDFAYATLGVLISCKHHKPPRVQAFIKPPTQAQLALQRGIGLLVFSSVVLLYGIAFLIPLSIQHGWVISGIIRKLAIVGISHPVLCLLFWGPVDLFGLELPLWLLCSLFHILLALPLYAKAVQTHRPPTVPKSRGPRLLSLPLLAFVYVGVLGSLWAMTPTWVILGMSLLSGILTMVWVVSAAYNKESLATSERHSRWGMVQLAFLSPGELFRSRAGTAPGYLSLTSLMASGFFCLALYHCYPSQAPWLEMVGCVAGLLIFTLGASLYGVRSNAAAQFQEGEQLRKVIAGDVEPKEEGKPATAKVEKGIRGTPLGIIVMSFVLPLMAWIGAKAAGSGSLPVSDTVVAIFKTLGLVALSFNPFAGLLPVLGDPSLCGHGVIEKGINDLGATPTTIYFAHLTLYGLIALASFLLYPKPPPNRAEILEALTQRYEVKEDPEVESGPEPEKEAEEVKESPEVPEANS